MDTDVCYSMQHFLNTWFWDWTHVLCSQGKLFTDWVVSSPFKEKWCNLWNNFVRTIGFSSSVIVGSMVSMSFETLYLVYYYFGNFGNQSFHVNSTGYYRKQERAWTRCSRAEIAPGCQLPKHASSHLCAISICIMLGAEKGLGKHCGCENNKMNALQFCFN